MNRTARVDGGIRYVEVLPERTSFTLTYLLVHGLGGSLEQWSDVTTRLGVEARVVAIDVPGFGTSRTVSGKFNLDVSVARIAHFCRAHGLRDCIVVSHSIGCVVAARLAATEPALFARLVLVSGALVRAADLAQHPRRVLSNPGLGFIVVLQFLTGMFPIPNLLLRALAASRTMRSLTLWPFVAHPSRLPVEHLVETLTGSGSLAVLRILVTAKSIDFAGILSAVRQPVELITGAGDRAINGEDVARMRAMVNVCREHVIPGCGHWPWLEAPVELVDFIRARGSDGTPTD